MVGREGRRRGPSAVREGRQARRHDPELEPPQNMRFVFLEHKLQSCRCPGTRIPSWKGQWLPQPLQAILTNGPSRKDSSPVMGNPSAETGHSLCPPTSLRVGSVSLGELRLGSLIKQLHPQNRPNATSPERQARDTELDSKHRHRAPPRCWEEKKLTSSRAHQPASGIDLPSCEPKVA